MATEIFIPKMGANIEKVVIGKVYKKAGDTVNKSDILFAIVTDKATFDVEADATGTITDLSCREGDEVNVLTVVGIIGEKDKIVATSKIQATPKARKLAKENNIDINSVFVGRTNIIDEEDVKSILTTSVPSQEEKLLELSPRKQAEILTLSKTQNYLYSSVTMQLATTDIKRKVEKLAAKLHLRLSFNYYLYFCTALILRDFANMNALYTERGIKQYKDINLGIAINLDSGLVVPVIRSADKLTIEEFTGKASEIMMKAIKNTLTAKDFQDSTFTITDLSSQGSYNSVPIINKDQSAILAMGAQYDSCKLVKNKLVYDPKINLTVAFDHRVIDGKYALEFLSALKDKLQQP